ncbi:MAG: SpoIID/LytB domain-containing protein, partial [Clostridiaceae bacterium]|nr:SpoIID/LytB domain-containing protein [Clostridiaceae bacterium]
MQINSEQTKLKSLAQQVGAVEANIGALTEKQKALIQAKLEAESQSQRLMENVDVYSMPPSPYSGAFAVASYGVPHRVGLSQYGAYGRALDGQNYQQILGAYYNADLLNGYASMENIHVKGRDEQGRYIDEVMSFEGKYMKGIAEVPSGWPIEVQKAQAIIARSYAIAFTNNGQKSIQPNQSNQVYNMDKVSSSAASLWHEAVSATPGTVLAYNGSPISAFYSASAGGYTKLGIESGYYSQNLPWMKSIKDYGPKGPYEGPSYANSPYYRRFWGAKNDNWNLKMCTRYANYPKECNPWLTNEETQDLFNIILLMEKVGDIYNSNLSPLYYGYENTWNHQQVIDKLNELGVSSVGNISEILTYENNSGDTTTIVVKSTNYGVREFNAKNFKDVYYLRSPGTLHIKTSRFDFVSS